MRNILNQVPIQLIKLITASIQMIAIKEHNDIVQKLMKELQIKEKQVKAALKDKTKTIQQTPQLQPTQNEQALNRKMNQLNKEYKDRISTMAQQLRNKSLENKQLKERLTIKQNMEAKQKEHIAEILKKTYDRKPSSGADYKISALISHYEAQIDKKNKYSQNLQRQIKQLEILSHSQIAPIQNQNYKIVNDNEQTKGVSYTEHQKQINKIKTQAVKYRKLFEQKQKQYKDLSRRYAQITNQYYKLLNSYGIQENIIKSPKSLTQIKSATDFQIKNKKTFKFPNNALENLLTQMAYSQSQMEQSQLCKKGFASKVASIDEKGTKKKLLNNERDFDTSKGSDSQLYKNDGEEKLQQNISLMKIQQIKQFLKVDNLDEIMPLLIKLKSKFEQFNIIDTISRSLQVFFYNIGKGKLRKQDLVSALQQLQITYNHNMEAVDLLDEICIQAGAKRQKLKQKIKQLSFIVNEYHNRLKSIKFTQEIAKGNKVIEFIDFFELDKEEVCLPQQLIKIQEQLKSIDKFIKESKIILDINGQTSAQATLELILRYLQKTSALITQLQKKKSKNKHIDQ